MPIALQHVRCSLHSIELCIMGDNFALRHEIAKLFVSTEIRWDTFCDQVAGSVRTPGLCGWLRPWPSG
jgi:hypothetical protein